LKKIKRGPRLHKEIDSAVERMVKEKLGEMDSNEENEEEEEEERGGKRSKKRKRKAQETLDLDDLGKC
jgi:hypothetical protein